MVSELNSGREGDGRRHEDIEAQDVMEE